MDRYLLSAHTGPCYVGQMANKFRQAGIAVEQEGTENVLFVVEAPDAYTAMETLLKQYKKTHGTTVNFRPTVIRRMRYAA